MRIQQHAEKQWPQERLSYSEILRRYTPFAIEAFVLRSKPLPSGCSADWCHRTTPICCTSTTLEEGDGVRFFRPVRKQDLEGVICKLKASPYPFAWIIVKNPSYSQACRTQGMV